ncbi:PIN domain-containing protein [Polyangium aurulentum]|uniref:PIN domain-containing protein n=1 Tax=Polyangium aurulentum TaxID=2567896 RepID=UPI00146E0058|nr:PIN domain-containing protein [Polyangium aurulentum]UQA54611.1 PIN domain-containing protein [Polyangium aurulentum]
MSYALDTNVVAAALNGETRVVARLSTLAPEDIVLPTPVLAELVFGARLSARAAENLAKVERLAATLRTAPFNLGAARRFGEIKGRLRRQGRTKQDFDLAIASIALEQGAVLVTHDAALLDGDIPDLVVEDWLATTA